MKKSTAVTLLISGALIAGCNDPNNAFRSGYSSDPSWAYGTNQPITNNTYWAGHGYWHARYSDWFPYPYNYYQSGSGYYYGGRFYDMPDLNPMPASPPTRVYSSGGRSGFSDNHSSISRGGFGSSARGGGS